MSARIADIRKMGYKVKTRIVSRNRNNSADFLAEMIFETFKNSVVPYDGNLTNYQKETKELIKLCKRACDRIAKEIK